MTEGNERPIAAAIDSGATESPEPPNAPMDAAPELFPVGSDSAAEHTDPAPAAEQSGVGER